MDVEELFDRYAENLREAGGDPLRPAVRPVWEAFLSTAQEPVEGLTPSVNEDLLLVEISPEGPIVLDLVRRLGLEDETGDYLGSYVLTCRIFFSPHTDDSGIEEAQVFGNGCLAPEIKPTVDAFANEVEATPAFRALAGSMAADELAISAGPG
jgi:hypothetical protein